MIVLPLSHVYYNTCLNLWLSGRAMCVPQTTVTKLLGSMLAQLATTASHVTVALTMRDIIAHVVVPYLEEHSAFVATSLLPTTMDVVS
jgi:hypothetical protein